jgi:antitoxin component of MazEF toxin-antitoxin module
VFALIARQLPLCEQRDASFVLVLDSCFLWRPPTPKVVCGTIIRYMRDKITKQLQYLWTNAKACIDQLSELIYEIRKTLRTLTMSQIRIRERNQLTLPAAITTAANLQPDDALEVDYANGVITLVPVRKAPRRSIADFVGSAKGVWGETAEQIDEHLRTERDSWDR